MSMPIGPNNSGPLLTSNPNTFTQGDNSGSLTFPTAREVENIHRNADTNKRPESAHHSLGYGHNQAAFGDHGHDITSGGAPLMPNSAYVPVTDAAGNVIVPSTVPSFDFTQNLDTPQGQKDAIKQLIAVLGTLGVNDKTTSNNGVAPFNVHAFYPFEIVYGNTTITWSTAVALSDIVTATFNPPFTIAPRMTFGMVSTDAAIMFSPRMTGSPTTASVSFRVLASVAMGAGNTRPLHWIALSAKQWT